MGNTIKIGRNVSLDIAKGILILLMVIGHSGAPEWLVNMIYTFHMPCFFIISGLLFSEKYLSSVKTFCKKRIKSLWWPFVKWTWIFLLLHNLFFAIGIYSDPYSHFDIFKGIGKTVVLLHAEQMLGGFWFLSALFIASIVSIGYFKIFGLSLKSALIGITVFLIGAETLCILNFKLFFLNPCNLLACCYFITGSLFRLINFSAIKYKKIIGVVSIFLLALSFFNDKWEMLALNEKILIPYYFQSIIISFSFLSLLEIYQGNKWSKFFFYLGDKTLDVLIIHFLAFKLVSLLKISLFSLDYNHLSDFPVITENNTYFWIIYVVVAMIVSILFFKGKKITSIYFNKIIRLFKSDKNNLTYTKN